MIKTMKIHQLALLVSNITEAEAREYFCLELLFVSAGVGSFVCIHSSTASNVVCITSDLSSGASFASHKFLMFKVAAVPLHGFSNAGVVV